MFVCFCLYVLIIFIYFDIITVLICCVKELLLLLLLLMFFVVCLLACMFLPTYFVCLLLILVFCFVMFLFLLRLGTLLLDLHGIICFVFLLQGYFVLVCSLLHLLLFRLFASECFLFLFVFCIFLCLICLFVSKSVCVFDRVRKGRFRVRNTPDSFSLHVSCLLVFASYVILACHLMFFKFFLYVSLLGFIKRTTRCVLFLFYSTSSTDYSICVVSFC